jgi:hypothetical protein
MGNRAYIEIDSKNLPVPLYLYGHWSGEDNLTAVQNVLARTDRVGDPEYLTAQIFHEFAQTLGAYDGKLGFGIGVGAVGAVGNVPTIYLDADTGKYRIGSMP